MAEGKRERVLRIEGRKSNYSRDFLYGPFGQALLKRVKEGAVTQGDKGGVYCTCIEPSIPMSIHAIGSPPVYKLFSYPGHTHDQACENRLVRKEKAKAALEEDEIALFDQIYGVKRDMKLRIRSFHARSAPKASPKKASGSNPPDLEQCVEREEPFSTGKTSLYDRADILLSTLWHNLNLKNGRAPKLSTMFYEFYKTINEVHLVHDEKLEMITYVPRGARCTNVDSIAFRACYKLIKDAEAKGYHKARVFVLGRFEGIEPHITEGQSKITLLDPVKELKFSLITENSLWEKASAEAFAVSGEDVDYVISAEVQAERGLLTTHAVGVVPVFKGRGFPINSVNETVLAKHLLRHHFFFDKPSVAVPELRSVWNGYVPAFVILNPSTGKPAAVAEIFADESPDAIASRSQRLDYYNENEAIRTLYWDVYRDGKLPTGRMRALAEELNQRSGEHKDDGETHE